MRYLTLREVLDIHRKIVETSGGSGGVRNLSGLESAIARPRQTFGGQELYPSPADKAAALAFSLVSNHPFVDGNKRAAHAVMEVCLLLNGYKILATIEEQERLMLDLASGMLRQPELSNWLVLHTALQDGTKT